MSVADIQKFSRSHDLASEADLEALKYFPEESKSSPTSPSKAEKDIASALEKVAISTPDADAEAAAETEGESEDPFDGIPILHRAPAELYLFDLDADVFVIQEKDVSVDMASNGEYDGESCAMNTLRDGLQLTHSLACGSQEQHPVHLSADRHRDESPLRHRQPRVHVHLPRD